MHAVRLVFAVAAIVCGVLATVFALFSSALQAFARFLAEGKRTGLRLIKRGPSRSQKDRAA